MAELYFEDVDIGFKVKARPYLLQRKRSSILPSAATRVLFTSMKQQPNVRFVCNLNCQAHTLYDRRFV